MCVAATFAKRDRGVHVEILTSHVWILRVSSVYFLLHVEKGGVVRLSGELSGVNTKLGI